MSIINDLPPAPSRSDPATFSDKADALLGALDGFVSETNTVAGEVVTNKDSSATSASTATTQAGIATTQASNASTSASTATTQAGIATTGASTATTQAGIATTAASTATTQAGIATAAAASINLASPAAIGNVTPNTGAFTTLSASGNATFSANAFFTDTNRFVAASGNNLLIGADGGSGSVVLRANGSNIATASSTGLAVTGNISATGAISGSSAGVRLPTASPVYFNAGFTSYIQEVTAGNIQVVAGGSTSATFSSTGIAVTGAVSATDSVTIKKTGGLIEFRQNDNSRTGYVQEASGNLAIVGERAGSSLQLYSNNTLNATLDSAGNLGLGVTPSAWSASARAFQFGSLGMLFQNASGYPELAFNTYQNTSNIYTYKNTDVATRYIQSNGSHQWFTAASGTAGDPIAFGDAKMTLDASGNLLVGKTSTGSTTLGSEVLANGQINSASAGADFWNAYNTSAGAYRFYVTAAGTVFATTTTITAISDRRFKENIKDLDDGLSSVMALQPRSFDWKSGKGKDIKGDRGFIAQEFEQVFPDLIDEWKDPAPEGEEPYKAVRADLIPVLVKAIQEQQALITSLTARVTQLEGI